MVARPLMSPAVPPASGRQRRGRRPL